ncbi:hypothetical protein A2U01_0082203, partial [Trifolium medium]|nr:hypothetical protein [Trifolium medium]
RRRTVSTETAETEDGFDGDGGWVGR